MSKVIVLALTVFLSSCVNASGARIGLFSATAPVYAIMSGDLLRGEAVGYMDRTGTINLSSAFDPNMKCIGEFRYTGSKTGSGRISCSDGGVAIFQFNALSSLSGYGIGNSEKGPFSFTFGLTADESKQYLVVPAGRKLENSNGELLLNET